MLAYLFIIVAFSMAAMDKSELSIADRNIAFTTSSVLGVIGAYLVSFWPLAAIVVVLAAWTSYIKTRKKDGDELYF